LGALTLGHEMLHVTHQAGPDLDPVDNRRNTMTVYRGCFQ
jgi:hypothetical protein